MLRPCVCGGRRATGSPHSYVFCHTLQGVCLTAIPRLYCKRCSSAPVSQAPPPSSVLNHFHLHITPQRLQPPGIASTDYFRASSSSEAASTTRLCLPQLGLPRSPMRYLSTHRKAAQSVYFTLSILSRRVVWSRATPQSDPIRRALRLSPPLPPKAQPLVGIQLLVRGAWSNSLDDRLLGRSPTRSQKVAQAP
jgi:hypothetical protein